MVKESTRRAVLDAAESLGYRPNRAAKALSTGKTGTVGIVVPDLTNPFFPSLLKGAQAAARAADFYVLVADTHVDPLAEAELVRAVSKQVDGVVVCSSRLADEELQALGDQFCLVCVNRLVQGTAAVLMASSNAVERAVEHLAALGHCRIAYVNGPLRSWSSKERREAFVSASARVGAQGFELGPVVPHFETGLVLATEVSSLGVTAVVAYNDLVALGLVAGLRQQGLDVPGDVSIVGIDDIVMASMAAPPLTTIRMPTESAGQNAVQLLLRLLGNGPPSGNGQTALQLQAEYVVRATTGPPPRTAEALAGRRPAPRVLTPGP